MPKPRRGAGSTSVVRAGFVAAAGRFGVFAFAVAAGAFACAFAVAAGVFAFVAGFAADAFAADDFGEDAFAALLSGFGAETSPASRGLRARRCGCGSPSP
jgi:hypothetical protein